MIRTLTWKELREHQAIWLTMILMTVLMGWGLVKIVSQDARFAASFSAMTILGMIATYGVVCGAMMFAGEHEGGTLVFLDVFHGRRDALWFGKFAIGAFLALTEGLAVALILHLMNQQPAAWIQSIAGFGEGAFHLVRDENPTTRLWFLVLPILALEAYFWGLLGSSIQRKVLPAAAIGAIGVTPLFLFTLAAPPIVAIPIRMIAAVSLLSISRWCFLNQSREGSAGPTPSKPKFGPDARDRFLELWDLYEEADHRAKKRVEVGAALLRPSGNDDSPSEPVTTAAEPERPLSRTEARDADSPIQVLWWLTLEQGKNLFAVMATVCLLIGFVIPMNWQVLWPLATLLLGVACGTAAFAAEQRDLSYQFLAAQHLPLKTIHRFKLAFWFAAGIVALFIVAIGSLMIRGAAPRAAAPPILAFKGTLLEQMGPFLFHAIWFPHGFCVAQIFVWLCRKNILALLISSMAALGAVSLWLPAIMCGGMNGWQMWVPPLLMLAATWNLVRAWAGGRIWERKPMLALVGFGAAIVVWVSLVSAYRAWSLPDIGEPIDRSAFRAGLPDGRENNAAKAIHQAIAKFDDKDIAWLDQMNDAARLPIGALEIPRGDGQTAILKHLAGCEKIVVALSAKSRRAEPVAAFDDLVQALAITRSLRSKAPLASYMAGVNLEAETLDAIDSLLARAESTPKLMRRMVDALNRHAEETPPPLECLETECFRSGGLLANPAQWPLNLPNGSGRVPERWATDAIAFSLDTPAESERKTRVWRLVWDGLFRDARTPPWQRPARAKLSFLPRKAATSDILDDWLPSETGISREQMARLLDSSWLAENEIFCRTAALRSASLRPRWRVDALRLTTALALHEMEEKKPAETLRDLVPKYLRKVPNDPYTGESFRYRVAAEGDEIGRAGQGVVWSVGPDRVDHGGKKQGVHLHDGDALWAAGGFDLIALAPR